jgi:hypothetical protein
MQAINLSEKLSPFSEHWQPRTVGQCNAHDLQFSVWRLRPPDKRVLR